MSKRAKKTIILWVAMVATLFIVFGSAIYIGENVEHHCNHVHCHICETILQCSEFLKTLSTGLVTVTVFTFVSVMLTESETDKSEELPCVSLISLKVRLNN